MSNEWKPIETAPKDGTAIIGYCANEPFPRPEIISWGELRQFDTPEDIYCWLSDYDFPLKPTHWIPLPKIPQE